jgi:hypothetical protein
MSSKESRMKVAFNANSKGRSACAARWAVGKSARKSFIGKQRK